MILCNNTNDNNNGNDIYIIVTRRMISKYVENHRQSYRVTLSPLLNAYFMPSHQFAKHFCVHETNKNFYNCITKVYISHSDSYTVIGQLVW